MSLSQADLERLDAAIASEELEVEVDGVRTKYRSVSELMRQRQFVAEQLAAQTSSAKPSVRYFRFAGSRD